MVLFVCSLWMPACTNSKSAAASWNVTDTRLLGENDELRAIKHPLGSSSSVGTCTGRLYFILMTSFTVSWRTEPPMSRSFRVSWARNVWAQGYLTDTNYRDSMGLDNIKFPHFFFSWEDAPEIAVLFGDLNMCVCVCSCMHTRAHTHRTRTE